MRSNLACLEGYPTHRDIIDMLNLTNQLFMYDCNLVLFFVLALVIHICKYVP